MAPLSAQDSRLASNDRITVAKLHKLGYGARATKYTLNAATLGAAGLSTNGLVALVRASIPRLLDAEGQELRPSACVASEVTVRSSGEADITLAFDLEA